MKPRTCPQCYFEIAIDKGFDFDENLNLVCRCGKIAFQTSEAPFLQDFRRMAYGTTDLNRIVHMDAAPHA